MAELVVDDYEAAEFDPKLTVHTPTNTTVIVLIIMSTRHWRHCAMNAAVFYGRILL